MAQVLFICRKHNIYSTHCYGLFNGLINSASFIVNHLREDGIDAKVMTAIDANSIDKFVTEENPKVVILEAIWVTPQKLRELFSIPRHQNRIWIIRVHSKITFLANEGIAFQWLLGYREVANEFGNLIIAPNTEEFANDLKETFELETVFLPNIYQPSEIPVRHFEKHGKHIIDVGCFGAIRPMKNNLAQAVAAVKFANNQDLHLRFHINARRTEQNGDQVLKNLRWFFGGQEKHTLVEHDWLTYEEFIHLTRTMDIGMQVSLSETFNIVAADCVSNDIPMVGSREIKWLPAMFCADPNSTDDIAKTLGFAWTQPGYMLRKLSNVNLGIHNSNAKKNWRTFITSELVA